MTWHFFVHISSWVLKFCQVGRTSQQPKFFPFISRFFCFLFLFSLSLTLNTFFSLSFSFNLCNFHLHFIDKPVDEVLGSKLVCSLWGFKEGMMVFDKMAKKVFFFNEILWWVRIRKLVILRSVCHGVLLGFNTLRMKKNILKIQNG